MASIPDLSGYVRDALEVELPEFTPRRTVYPTLDGWSSVWNVTETVRKVYVIWDDRR
jgi:hypothetical protein